MKHVWAKIACTGAFALTFGLALTGCSGGGASWEYDYLVTFDYNVGNLTDTEIEKQYLGVKENSLIVKQPTENDSNYKLKSITGYTFEGWYTGKYDASGNPVVGSDGRVVLDKEWNFATQRVTSDITLYANFEAKAKLIVMDADAPDGDPVKEYAKEVGQKQDRPARSLAPSKKGYTLIEYYEDKECTTPFEFPYVFGEEDKVIYAKFIEGTWTLVSTATEFMNAIDGRANVYVTAEELDFTNVSWTKCKDYNREIRGNGCTIKNISFTWEGSRQTNQDRFALFGTLGDNFKMTDITFENITANFTAQKPLDAGGSFEVALFALSLSKEATLENVSFTGTIEIARSSEATAASVKSGAICVNENELPEDLKQFFHITKTGE